MVTKFLSSFQLKASILLVAGQLIVYSKNSSSEIFPFFNCSFHRHHFRMKSSTDPYSITAYLRGHGQTSRRYHSNEPETLCLLCYFQYNLFSGFHSAVLLEIIDWLSFMLVSWTRLLLRIHFLLCLLEMDFGGLHGISTRNLSADLFHGLG